MPPLPPAPNTLRVDLHYDVGTDTNALNRLHFGYTGGPPAAADCVALAGDIRAAWNAHLASVVSQNNGLVLTYVQDLNSSTGKDGTDTTQVPGTRVGSNLGANTAVLMNHKISRRYRGGKPRTYFPGGVSSDILGAGNWQSTFLTSVNAGWAAFIAAVIGSASGTTTIASFVNVGYYHGFHVVTNPITGRARNVPNLLGAPNIDAVVSSSANTRLGTQRRRARP